MLAVRRVKPQDDEQLVLETVQQLKRHENYTIRFTNFTGLIGDDLRGLYRSTYRYFNGTQRSVGHYEINLKELQVSSCIQHVIFIFIDCMFICSSGGYICN